MRGVRDEFAPRVVQLRKANAHALERVGKPAQLAAARVAHGRVEAPARDPVGSPLEPPNAAREEPCTPVAKQQGDQQGNTRGDQQAALHLMDARKLVLERVGQKESGRTARHEDGRLRVAPAAPFHRPVLGALPQQRADGDRVGLDVLGQRRAARVPEHLQERLGLRRKQRYQQHTRVRAGRGVLDEVLLVDRRSRDPEGEVCPGLLELRGPRLDQAVLKGGNDRLVDDTERHCDDDQERQAELCSDAAKRATHLRKR
jgi:hypothetical protein